MVVLKTQAHVYFLSGTSHILHLPFEIESVFPLLHGVLLQRKVINKPKIQATPVLPSVPLNSFAFSHQASSWPTPHLEATRKINYTPSVTNMPPSFSTCLLKLFSQSSGTVDLALPRSFSMTDPFAEIGVVTTSQSTDRNGHIGIRGLSSLNVADTIVYISPSDELPQPRTDALLDTPVLLALTANFETGMYNLWSITFTDRGFTDPVPKRNKPYTSAPRSRRRSSYGVATGATTPAGRVSLGPRESIGGNKDGVKQWDLEDEVDLAAKLDPAFENPGAPAKSSRRVSSLVARSELSTSHGRSVYTDLAASHSAIGGTRKGHSFGHHETRTSNSSMLGFSEHTLASHKGTLGISQPNGVSNGSNDLLDEDSLEELDSADEFTNPSISRQKTSPQGLCRGVSFGKIDSIPNGQNYSAETVPDLTVFTLQPPSSGVVSTLMEIHMCMIDHEGEWLAIMKIQISYSRTQHNRSRLDSHWHDRKQAYEYKVVNTRTASGVIDACKVSDGSYSRILVLRRSNDGFGEMTLEAPWSTLLRIKLPSSLSVYDPYQIIPNGSPGQKRRGGIKRILSQGPQALTAVRHSTGNCRLDLLDQQSTRHRLAIQLSPKDTLVISLIQVCHLVIPQEEAEQEPILRVWWDVISWLRDRSEREEDLEWTALVIVLFSLAIGLIDDHQVQSTARQKRRNTGFLRSSSGSNFDMVSWDDMLSKEGNLCRSLPVWMQSQAWEWTLEEEVSSPVSQVRHPRRSRTSTPATNSTSILSRKSSFVLDYVNLAREFVKSSSGQSAFGKTGYLPTATSKDFEARRTTLPSLLIGLHLYREELKLDILNTNKMHTLTPILAQIGGWLGWDAWSWRETAYYGLESSDMEQWLFDESVVSGPWAIRQTLEPPSILSHIEDIVSGSDPPKFINLFDVSSSSRFLYDQPDSSFMWRSLRALTPRTLMIIKLFKSTSREATTKVIDIIAHGLHTSVLESLPEGVVAPLHAAISLSQANPVSTWGSYILDVIGRDDVSMLEDNTQLKPLLKSFVAPSHRALRDTHAVCISTLEPEIIGVGDGSPELHRQLISGLLFKDDHRISEAVMLVNPLKPPTARCAPEPDWSDTDLLEAQQELVKIIASRTLSVSPGRGMLFYSARLPLLTEKFPIHGFTLGCVMKPTNTTVTADRNVYTEEKVSWAFFHAGVEAGLSIAKNARGIDTSWILSNKPPELNNRHAGFLLALGLNGHLKSIAKWVAYKYLTPKHTMTSIGLLLGLSASYLGTMDTLVTRLLSVHVTRMLPPGAAELNLSPLTQTTGIMAIGLLYCNTQHRRMSEIMISEMENVEQDENISPMEDFRDEGYRLAAGFALGYINLGQGKNLKGLHDMHILERLLILAVGTRKVDIVHILDKATAAATVAIALIFMKTHDKALARKIDIPDTTHQFDYVRPDIFLLRTVARHLIMWDNITPTTAWMQNQLPLIYQSQVELSNIRTLATEDMPLFNIVAGLCFSIGLRYAGTARSDVRELLIHYLDQFIRITRLPALNYDGKLTRITTRNCQDLVALAAASVMSGTGDLLVFRRLRSLHGRTDPDTPYGSHLATHLAVGALFLAGGTHTFGTSNLAVASLLCAFYPLFPSSVLDNKCHLQAFRHFWVLAAEARCLVARDVDTQRPVSISILVRLHSGETTTMLAPCLLPELQTIASVSTNDPKYWRVTLDFADNPKHLQAFARHQSIYVRRRAAYDAHSSVFSATMQALNDAQFVAVASAQLSTKPSLLFDWIFDLPALAHFDRTERALVLPLLGGGGGGGAARLHRRAG